MTSAGTPGETLGDEGQESGRTPARTGAASARASEGTSFRHWHSLSDGFLVSLVIVGPSFLFEELWRGRPLIDQPGNLWIVFGAIMAIGFFAGGGVGGRHRRHAGGAFNQGLLIAALTLILIFVADVIRRLILHAPLTWEIMGLWCAAAAGGLLVSGLGALSARRRRRKLRRRAQVERVV